ncbi:MAG TPA: response regulator transcription factor [Vicinamibacteria bacterium]
MREPVRIVLADDHELVRQGVRALLQAEADLQVVGEAGDGLTALQMVERLTPDVLVADLTMPGLGGLELTHQTVRRSPRTRVVILTMHSAEPFVLEALEQGASAYVLKDAGVAELLRGIRETASGRRYLSPPLSDKAVAAYTPAARTVKARDDPYERLTLRERQVLHLAAEGLRNPAIAERLGISVRTAETHRGRVLGKLGLRSQTELVRWALRRGVVRLDEGEGPPEDGG